MKISKFNENQTDKVQVKLDAKTIILVNREKCEQLADGTWIKKTPLNVVKFKEEYAASLKNRSKKPKKEIETINESINENTDENTIS